MGNKRAPGIRNSLICDREKQEGYRLNIRKQSFGIYRALTKESEIEVTGARAKARANIMTYLKEARGTAPIANLIDRVNPGVTFVDQGRVNRAMRGNMFQNGFMLGRMIESIEQHNNSAVNEEEAEEAGQPVAIGNFDWRGQKRTLVAELGYSEGLKVLLDETQIIEDIMGDSKASGIEVREPDHLSLLRYGRQGDNMDLSRRQLWEVADITRLSFEEAKVTEVVFGKMIVGSYQHPLGRVV